MCSKPRYELNGNKLRTLNAPLHHGEAVGVHSNSSVFFYLLDAASGNTASKHATESPSEWGTDCAGKPYETSAIFLREKDLEMIRAQPRSAGNI
ncbi:hypothetical protein M404DRAFT_1005226 [Pisolithus tinctorius Marx 270]|uniref:Uncharacterized protein n=1 Tax=Pisolithus tinctorius Marx 270 TaxID=870435 RepID=A0A0C3NBP7_PISTI|nr:hypothetical protein M404DRAFT_1005226 [Pisolithus tinctorius Marx 270]